MWWTPPRRRRRRRGAGWKRRTSKVRVWCFVTFVACGCVEFSGCSGSVRFVLRVCRPSVSSCASSCCCRVGSLARYSCCLQHQAQSLPGHFCSPRLVGGGWSRITAVPLSAISRGISGLTGSAVSLLPSIMRPQPSGTVSSFRDEGVLSRVPLLGLGVMARALVLCLHRGQRCRDRCWLGSCVCCP